MLSQITPRIIGEDPFDITRVCNFVNPLGPFTNRFAVVAASGVEMALLDIYGKAVEQPVYKLLGGAVHPLINLYASIHWAMSHQNMGWLEIPWLPEGYEFPAKIPGPSLGQGQILLPEGPGFGVPES